MGGGYTFLKLHICIYTETVKEMEKGKGKEGEKREKSKKSYVLMVLHKNTYVIPRTLLSTGTGKGRKKKHEKGKCF